MENDRLGVRIGRGALDAAGLTRRSLWLSAALCLSVAALGCSDNAAPVADDESAAEDDVDAKDEGKDQEGEDDEAATKVDASKTQPRDAGATPSEPKRDASAAPQIDASSSGGGASSDDGGGATGSEAGPVKLALPSPNDPGPYEVIEEDNVGEGFENPIDSNDRTGESSFCYSFVSLFGQDEQTNREYSSVPEEYNMALYTLYRPKPLQEGQKFPVLSWANGTCAHTVGYVDMLKHVASHGFIVIATHSRFTASGAAQLRGIDFVHAANDDPMSPLYKQVDTELVGLFGHSQGGGSTGVASKDPRVDTSILMNGGNGSNLHAPAFFMTGEMDSPSGPRGNYNSSRVPAAFGSLKMANHITMMTEYEREAPEVVAWFRYQLLGDEEAKGWFVGSDCLLCKDSEWEYLSKDLE